MKPIVLLSVILVFVSGCGKPPAEEYMKKAQEAEKGGLWSIALENYQKLINDHPGDALAETAVFNIAAIQHNNMQNFQAAVDGYKLYLEKYPDAKRAPTALFLTAFLYHNELKYLDSARVYYQLFLAKYPANEMATSAQFELENLGKSPDELLPKPVVVDKTPSKPDKKVRSPGKN